MIITAVAYRYLISNAYEETGEIGGILGGTADGCVTDVIFDKPSTAVNRYYYEPNTSFLNEYIAEWQQKEIVFLGMFHSHVADVSALSNGDRRYIDKIMSVMPEQICSLWFPILVFPQKRLCCYRADRSNGRITISQEPLRIIG